MMIFTIGYEGMDIFGFISLLRKHQIDTLDDIRELPLSRKPGFSKKALSNTVSLCGLDYIHLPDLGCPKPIRNRFREDGNWSRYKQGFLKYLDAQGLAVAELAKMAKTANCALLCFEADPGYCHRSMVADAVVRLGGLSVYNILSAELKTVRTEGLELAVV